MTDLDLAPAAAGRGALKRCGLMLAVSPSAISSWRSGKTEPSGEHALLLAKKLYRHVFAVSAAGASDLVGSIPARNAQGAGELGDAGRSCTMFLNLSKS